MINGKGEVKIDGTRSGRVLYVGALDFILKAVGHY